MKKFFNPLNIIFTLYIASVVLIAFGFMQREFILPISALIALYVLISPLEDSTVFFVRAIPFFVALPLTSYFDSFNLWRIISGLIFLKWFFLKNMRTVVYSEFSKFFKKPLDYMSTRRIIVAVCIFFVMAGFSLLAADDIFAGLKRIIYLINLSLIGFVLYDLAKAEVFAKRIVVNLAVPGVLVAIIGALQLASTYFLTFWQFISFWAEHVQKIWYGGEWSGIVFNSNTWFAYFGNQLSLRMFSTFPDSHTFPIFILMTIPALLAVSLVRVIGKTETWKEMIRARLSLWIIFLPLMYLTAILSGTRGIWLAVLGPIFALPFILHFTRNKKDKASLKFITSFLTIFFLLFLVANPILTSNQFKLAKDSDELLRKRIRSILDLSEESNVGRIHIWKETLISIGKRPLLGVGIGNFPTVLGQTSESARAGSSAHNLYLQIAAEMGLISLYVSLIFFWEILKRGFNLFKRTGDIFIKVYGGSAVLYMIWVLLYLMTDAALFDERAFLVFTANAGIILGLSYASRS